MTKLKIDVVKNARGRYLVRRDTNGKIWRYEFFDKNYKNGHWWTELHDYHATEFLFKWDAINWANKLAEEYKVVYTAN